MQKITPPTTAISNSLSLIHIGNSGGDFKMFLYYVEDVIVVSTSPP